MKRKLKLRSIRLVDYERQRILAHWRRSAFPVRLEMPKMGLCYISFWAQGPQGLWQGMIQPQQWITNVLPELLELLPGKVTDDDVLALFSAVERPIETDAERLDYKRLFEISLINSTDLSCDKLPVIATMQCPLWLLTPPGKSHCRPHLVQPWLQRLPLPLRYSLGTSTLGAHQLRCLAPGDVLRIAQQINVSVVADRYIGPFTIVKEGLSMQCDTTFTHSLLLDSPLSEMAVKLEFVLEERTISLAELNELISGTVLSLDVEAIQQIEVRVAGKTIATGELIQVDEGLGVELREMTVEAAS